MAAFLKNEASLNSLEQNERRKHKKNRLSKSHIHNLGQRISLGRESAVSSSSEVPFIHAMQRVTNPHTHLCLVDCTHLAMNPDTQ